MKLYFLPHLPFICTCTSPHKDPKGNLMHSITSIMFACACVCTCICVCMHVCVCLCLCQPDSLFLPEPQWWCRAMSLLLVSAEGREQSFEVGSDFSPRYQIDQQRYWATENTAWRKEGAKLCGGFLTRFPFIAKFKATRIYPTSSFYMRKQICNASTV